MKTTMKKVLSMALALVLLLGMLPMAAQATSTETPQPAHHDYHYDHSRNGVCDVPYCTEPVPDCGSNHNFDNPSCTVDRTCLICGGVDPAEAAHNGTLKTDATKHWYECTVCHQTYDEASHSAATYNTTDATAHWKNCGTCGVEFDRANHTGSTATCTTGSVCTVCNKVLSGAAGSNHVGKSTTWTTDDSNHWKTCSYCPTAEIDKAEHSFVSLSCTQKRCSVCQLTVEVTGHDYLPATCTAPGKCRFCGYTNPKAANPLNHDWADATCITAKTCRRCGTTEGNALGHDWSGGATTCRRNCGATKDTVRQFTVYYNANVNASATQTLKAYDIYTPMSTILSDLSFKGVTYPGRYPTWYSLEGWYTDVRCTNRVNANTQLTSDITLYAKWNQNYHYEVVLKLFTNGNTNNVVKVVDAFFYVQNDGILSRDEIQMIAKDYFEPVSNAGLIVYGPYDSSDWSQYTLYSNRMAGQEQYIVQDNGTIVLYAMIHNVAGAVGTTTAKKADSTNPKTGDMIMMPAAVLGLSTSALAVMFYLNKKKRVM